jgi:hypothetical protein
VIRFFHQANTEAFSVNVRKKLLNDRFLCAAEEIWNFDPDYTSTGVTGADIINPLLRSTDKIRIGLYTQNWFAFKAFPVNAYVPKNGRDIFFNRRNVFKRDMVSIERTLWHELVHISDDLNQELVYWHGDNNLTGKDETAPVKFAKWAASWTP